MNEIHELVYGLVISYEPESLERQYENILHTVRFCPALRRFEISADGKNWLDVGSSIEQAAFVITDVRKRKNALVQVDIRLKNDCTAELAKNICTAIKARPQ